MDIFLVLGVITGFLAVVVGMYVKGADVMVLLNPAAAIIIIIGTIAAVVNSFPKKEILQFPKIVGVLFGDKHKADPVEIIKQISQMAQKARQEGLLALEESVQSMENPFFKRGVGLVVDGVDQETIRDMLDVEIESMEERHRVGAAIFTSAGGAAPTLGVLGAVIGLIGALGNLDDTEKLGHMIAAAFVATMYGIFIGYVLCHPFASRLKRKSHHEISVMRLIVEGVLSIQAGENPKNIEMKLMGMLDAKERKAFEIAEK